MVANPVVRVWFPATAVEVVRLCCDWGSSRWADRKALWDERGPVGRYRGLIVRSVQFHTACIIFAGRGKASSELGRGLGHDPWG